jgi:hypothetical protein
MSLNSVAVDHCEAYANTGLAMARGGGVSSSNGPVNLTNSRVTNSVANGYQAANGGAIYARSYATITNSYITGIATSSNGNAAGGGIDAFNLVLNNSTVEDSYATAHGGV